ncbi:Trehalose phosphorylase [Penicillium rolfsii]|nr:Trehalose phosphorylase [Penicillium rolfsii]
MLRSAAGFDRHGSQYQHTRVLPHLRKNDWSGPTLNTIFAGVGLSAVDGSRIQVAIALRDVTYLLDFLTASFSLKPTGTEICDFILSELQRYSDIHLEKILGVAIPRELQKICPSVCSRLWAELDIIPIVLDEDAGNETEPEASFMHLRKKEFDEQAESLSRKCTRFFGPNNLPFLHVGFLGKVEVDAGFHICLTDLDRYKQTVRAKTWKAVQHYAGDLRSRKVKIAFFSATPQGGGVALMRHALIRFAHEIGVDITWFVPKPHPGVFRITKTNHNILQGVSAPEDRLDRNQEQLMVDWIQENAERYWLRKDGPLCHPSEGGADVIVVDDPQMPALIPAAKRVDPNRPVIYRSHIQMRSDLIASPGSPQAELWKFLWNHIQYADVFISQPVEAFVPHNVPEEIVGYMPACTDWLDGLNKNMRDWDIAFYGRIFNHSCKDCDMPTIIYPDEPYIIQIARFDPAKGIFDVLSSYKKFCVLLSSSSSSSQRRAPKLLICGHGSIDDPDGSIVYDAVLQHIDEMMPDLKDQICVMRLGPSDQILNALLSKAHIVLQLSIREGFEVKVSEAIHKGKPVIVTRAGGIPLQVKDQKNGFLVDVGDTDAVARHIFELWTNPNLYEEISAYSTNHLTDEVSTVGHALNWLFLSSELSKGHKIRPHKQWIQDLARASLDQKYDEGDGKLKRSVDQE